MEETNESLEKFGAEALKKIHQFSIDEILYMEHKWGADPENYPGKFEKFVHPKTFEPCVYIEFNNSHRGYVTMTTAEEAGDRLNATDNRQTS